MSDTRLYDVLNVSRSASDGEIRREYHKLAKRFHPDKNPGNEEKFKEIQEAYEILSDSEKRGLYDRFGMDAVKNDGTSSGFGFPFGGGGEGLFSHGGGESLFSQFFGSDMFGGFGGGGGRRRRQKGETLGIPLEVTLEELFKGALKHVEYKRKELCKTCRGHGGKQGSVTRCRKCQGSGIEVKLRQIGPGMMQQMQSKCSDCQGSGDFIREKDRCKKCKGKRVMELDHKLEVPVAPGMSHGQKIPFSGEADQIPDGDAGDVVVVLQQMDHTTFKRKELDLYVDKKISLRQALCGFKFAFEHLDGRKMCLTVDSGEVISPGSVMGIEGEGMCHPKHRDLRGNLYFVFDVEFPEDSFLDQEGINTLEALLPTKPRSPVITEEMEEVNMVDFEGTRSAEGRSEVYDGSDEEEESGGHGHRMGCEQQ